MNFSVTPSKWQKMERPLYRYRLHDDGHVTVTVIWGYETLKGRRDITEYRFPHDGRICRIKEPDMGRVLHNNITSLTCTPEEAVGFFRENLVKRQADARKALAEAARLESAMAGHPVPMLGQE